MRKEISSPLGNPSYPMTGEACEEKFRKCARYSVSSIEAGQLDNLIETISRLENLRDVSAISPWPKEYAEEENRLGSLASAASKHGRDATE